jgi:hypothetical protein
MSFLLCSDRAKKALWFAESFGLSPTNIQLTSSTGQSVQVNLNDVQDNGKISEIT